MVSREKLTAQRLDATGAGGAGGAGGAITFTLVFAVAVLPLSSTTLQVTPIGPGEAPAVDSVVEVPVPLTEPAVEL